MRGVLEFVLTSVLERETHANKYSNPPCLRSQIYRRTEAKIRTNTHTYINRVTSLCRLLRLHQWQKTSLWRLLFSHSLHLIIPPRDKQRTWASEAGPGRALIIEAYMFHRKGKAPPQLQLSSGDEDSMLWKTLFFFLFKERPKIEFLCKNLFLDSKD